MLIWVFTAAAVLCLVYYGVIVLYAGFGTSFAVLWLLIGGFFGATAAGIHFYQKYPERVPLWLPVSFVTLCASGLMIVLVTQILIFGRIPAAAEPSLDYVIVLGAKVKPDGSLSKTLKLRLDKALEYMKENPETMLVLSGAKGDAEPCSEADAKETYLLGQGADPDHLLKEEQSFSTVENLAYSRVMIEKRENLLEQERKAEADRLLRAQGEIEGVPETGAPANNTPVLARQPRVGIITSNFHLCRAAMIAKKAGLWYRLRHCVGGRQGAAGAFFPARRNCAVKRPPDGESIKNGKDRQERKKTHESVRSNQKAGCLPCGRT
ncbi:MAG: YdcF family protein [Clostridium sp.]